MLGWGSVELVPDSVAVVVYRGGSTLAELVFDGPRTLPEGPSKFSNGFCDFSLVIV